MSQADVRAAQQ